MPYVLLLVGDVVRIIGIYVFIQRYTVDECLSG